MKDNFLDIKKPTLLIIYILGFILAFSSAIPAYINSSFIGGIVGTKFVGLIYSLGSILSLITLVLTPKLLIKYGNYKVILFYTVLYFLDFLGLAFTPNIFLLVFFFLITGSIATVIYYNLDVFLEHNSYDSGTGSIRSIYLTSLNLAWLVSPWISGLIVSESGYRKIYFIVSLIVLLMILVILSDFRDFKDPEYKKFSFVESIKSVEKYKNIEKIIFSSFILQFFYSWMVLYTPIYLYKYIGFDWTTIGIIFSIALLPFVFIQIPFGYIADKWLGEKEILTLGFIITAVSTIWIPFISTNSVFVWATVLFMTRVGAAMVEVMNDTYFFKKVSDKNLNVISLYRTVGPIVYIVSPIIATLVLQYTSYDFMFISLGIFILWGLRFSLTIKDTL